MQQKEVITGLDIRFAKSVWTVDADVIARNAADYYSKNYGADYKYEYETIIRDEIALISWLVNQMQFADTNATLLGKLADGVESYDLHYAEVIEVIS